MNEPVTVNLEKISHRFLFPVRATPGRVYISWYDIPMASFELEPLPDGSVTDVVQRWSEKGKPRLRLQSPSGREMIFELIFTFQAEGAMYGILSLPADWPGDEVDHGSSFVVQIVGSTHLCTVDGEVFRRLIGYLQSNRVEKWDISDAAEVFGSFYSRTSSAVQMESVHRKVATETCCMSCNKPITSAAESCPHCNAKRTAPNCPNCHQPVTDAMDERLVFLDENGYYPWHCRWNYRCVHCDFDFSTSVALSTGHSTFFESDKNFPQWASSVPGRDHWSGASLIEISSGDSLNLNMDCWDLQPTVRVQVSRLSSANRQSSEFDLAKNDTIVMTVHEWKAVIQQLSGPLSVLLERKNWSRDTT